MAKTTHTHRGTCQACGKTQAVDNKSSLLAKHGYTVNYGAFQFVCQGADDYVPAELDVTLCLFTMKTCLESATFHDGEIPKLKSGEVVPDTFERWNAIKVKTVKTAWGTRESKGDYDTLPIAKATKEERRDRITGQIHHHTLQAEGLRGHEAFLRTMVLTRRGQPLYANPATTKRVYAKGMHFIYQPEVKGGTEYVLQYEAYSRGFGRERLIGWYALNVKMPGKPVRFTTRELNQSNLKP